MNAKLTITLPPTPKPGRTLQEFIQAVSVWTRQAQQAIVALHAAVLAQSPTSQGSEGL